MPLIASDGAPAGPFPRCGDGGTYTTEGITAITDALRVHGALTKIEKVPKFRTPIANPRTDTWLTLRKVIDHPPTLVPRSLRRNDLEEEGEALIRKAVQGKAGFKLRI